MIDSPVLERVLSEALRHGGDFAEVFAEDKSTSSALLDDGRVEELSSGRERGAGIRVVAGETTGFAHTADLSEAGPPPGGRGRFGGGQGRGRGFDHGGRRPAGRGARPDGPGDGRSPGLTRGSKEEHPRSAATGRRGRSGHPAPRSPRSRPAAAPRAAAS